jgi:hypothetical protein
MKKAANKEMAYSLFSKELDRIPLFFMAALNLVAMAAGMPLLCCSRASSGAVFGGISSKKRRELMRTFSECGAYSRYVHNR